MSERTIFRALSNVQRKLCEKGIGKDGTNKYDNYSYRSIDAVLNTLAPILAEEKVLIMPHVIDRKTEVVPTAKGGKQYHTIVTVDYHCYDEHGDSVLHRVQGENMDRGDKSINKAMSAAYKYFLFQAFCVPLEGMDDGDAQSHELAPEPEPVITDAQLDELQGLVMATSTDPVQFLQYLKHDGNLPDLPQSKFNGARNALNKKLAAQEAAATPEPQADSYEEAAKGDS